MWTLTTLLGLNVPNPGHSLLSFPSLCLGCKAVLRLNFLSALSSWPGTRQFQLPSPDFLFSSNCVPALDQILGSFSWKCCQGWWLLFWASVSLLPFMTPTSLSLCGRGHELGENLHVCSTRTNLREHQDFEDHSPLP